MNDREVENRGEKRHKESNMDWVIEMKVRLVELERQVKSNGNGFMARLKRRWDEEYEGYRFLDAQCLRNNSSRFSKEQSVLNLVLVWERSDANTLLEVTTPRHLPWSRSAGTLGRLEYSMRMSYCNNYFMKY